MSVLTHCSVTTAVLEPRARDASHHGSEPARVSLTNVAGSGLLSVFLCCGMVAAEASAADMPVGWNELADVYGRGAPNWRTLAIMNQAMHDAVNAARPVYARWSEARADEPSARGASVEAAMAAAARRVLFILHPERLLDTQLAYRAALEDLPDGPAKEAGERLGDAIGRAAVEQRSQDGTDIVEPFTPGEHPGAWRQTPARMQTSPTTETRPFMFTTEDAYEAPPPPPLDSDVYRKSLEEVEKLGGFDATARTEEQTEAAVFWASQSSQRGYLQLALRLLDEQPLAGGPHAEVRFLSQLTTALADSGIMTWHAKEYFSFWRPVTAIREGSPGVKPTPWWMPMLETPPFPEYPSGHAVDCYVGALVIDGALGPKLGPVIYISHRGDLSGERLAVSFGMGNHAQATGQVVRAERPFPSIRASADECAESRIWAGAHYRWSLEGSKQLAEMIAGGALGSVGPISGSAEQD